MKIYTKTGDKGNTSLYDGTKVCKDNIIIECIGSIDELNTDVGCFVSYLSAMGKEDLNEQIAISTDIQSQLFDLGAIIACPNNKKVDFDMDQAFTKSMESAIDSMTVILPKLKNFILPGGSIEMSMVHRARTACRRSERRLVNLKSNEVEIVETCLIFINRLSDYLFTLARYVGHVQQIDEVIYRKNRKATA